jgi:arylsulfatase A-like enzyme
MSRYDHEVATVDAALGALLKNLEDLGRLENTFVVVTADHGEGFFEHGEITHGFAPYDEVARVPMVIRPPRASTLPRGVRRSVVSHVDFSATILDLLGLEPLPGTDGTSYLEVLRGTESERSAILQAELSSGLRDGRFKLIQRVEGKVELYDLEKDPGETVDLAAAGCEDDCRRLLAELRERLRALGPPRSTGAGSFDAEEAEELRALGYL